MRLAAAWAYTDFNTTDMPNDDDVPAELNAAGARITIKIAIYPLEVVTDDAGLFFGKLLSHGTG